MYFAYYNGVSGAGIVTLLKVRVKQSSHFNGVRGAGDHRDTGMYLRVPNWFLSFYFYFFFVVAVKWVSVIWRQGVVFFFWFDREEL